MTLSEASGAPRTEVTSAPALASVSRLPLEAAPAPANHGGYRLQPDFYEPARVPAEVLRHAGRPATLRVGSPGKVGVLQLEFQLHGGTTQLTHHYQKSPLQIMRPLYFDPARPDMPYVYLTSTGGGILQGDRLRTDLTFGPHSATHVTSQAHSKVYKMDRDYATSLMNLTVGEGAFVEYLPDPVIPFERSRLYQRTAVVLDESATLVLSETVYAGRLARGERHEYDVYASDLEVRRPDGSLAALDRVRLCPADTGVGGMGVLAGRDVLSMLYVFVPPDAAATQVLADAVHETLTGLQQDDLVFGVSALPGDAGICLRLVGDDTVVTTHATALVSAVVHKLLTGHPAPPIRKC
ncbi:urease accessory protein UreD [Aeromicrobium chenweiae]|uniref:Urease accessory protein UreD n=1 Tax=Aeromicrobium chenweiae TaxID=2079793 RepID=A0A2S0WLV8_9ACTN|nr:urease accessory protein UreD [Aeromicrobium chenweiae]AWB92328.1 urease accessory protein [Aeromicrobium chenweiae]TGN31386.1 urease accessory protein UreD [Aeromicrobium chenweiae]